MMLINSFSGTWQYPPPTCSWNLQASPGIADGQRFGRFPTIGYIRVYPTNEFTGQRQNAKRIAIDHFSKPSNHIWGCGRLKSLVGALRTGDAAQRDELTKGGDQLLLCISADAEVSVLSLVATEVVREAQRRHNASPTASAALGRALMGTLLLGALKGDAETVQVTFLGDGPLGQMTTIATEKGFVKGFVGNPSCDPPLKPTGKLDVGTAVGSGVLSVVRNHSDWKQPYIGTVPIYSGEVAEDIAHYLADSEQVNTALGLGVGFDREQGIRIAGGFLVQVLPFCSEETLAKLEENILRMQPISDAVEHLSASDIVEALLDGIGVGDYNNSVIPQFGPCGADELKARMMKAVASLGPVDLRQILQDQGRVEVRCEFCGDTAQFKEADLQHILQ